MATDAPAAFTISNAVLIAVAQVGVVTLGCLAAATSARITEQFTSQIRLPTLLLRDYWYYFMAIPLAWITCALRLRRRDNVSGEAKGIIFWFGLFLLGGLIVLALTGFFGPLFLDDTHAPIDGAQE